MKNTNTDKLSEAERNYNWYSIPVEFNQMVGQSAKGKLGGKWKSHFKTEEIFSYAEMDGMKPYDMKVACIKTETPKSYSAGDEVQIQVNAGDKRYNGTHKLVGISGHFLILPLAMSGGASGTILNTSRIMKHKQECLKWSNVAQQQSGRAGRQVAGSTPIDVIPDTSPANGGRQVAGSTPAGDIPTTTKEAAEAAAKAEAEALEKAAKKKKIIKGALITLAVAIALYGTYKGYQYLQKSKSIKK